MKRMTVIHVKSNEFMTISHPCEEDDSHKAQQKYIDMNPYEARSLGLLNIKSIPRPPSLLKWN